jgi:hypothetical protein
VARFASCDCWTGKYAVVSEATAVFLQKARGIRNAYKHGTTTAAGVSDESASERRRADGINARASMTTYIVFS